MSASIQNLMFSLTHNAECVQLFMQLIIECSIKMQLYWDIISQQRYVTVVHVYFIYLSVMQKHRSYNGAQNYIHVFTLQTQIQYSNFEAGKNEDIFPNPDNFDPDRWRRDEDNRSAFAFLPFGFGPRACYGTYDLILHV